MSHDILPFARGTTWGGGDTVTAGDCDSIAGRVYEVRDDNHNTGQTVKLRCVVNDTGSSITVTRVGYTFGTAALDFGRYVSGTAGQGAVGKPLDDSYTTGDTIPANDAFYVVEEGPCYILGNTASTVTQYPTAGAPCCFDTGGVIDDTAPEDDDFVVGMGDALFAATNTVQVVWVRGGLHREGTG